MPRPDVGDRFSPGMGRMRNGRVSHLSALLRDHTGILSLILKCSGRWMNSVN